jgi:hypothetical protein
MQHSSLWERLDMERQNVYQQHQTTVYGPCHFNLGHISNPASLTVTMYQGHNMPAQDLKSSATVLLRGNHKPSMPFLRTVTPLV